jgi:hypothetical protein
MRTAILVLLLGCLSVLLPRPAHADGDVGTASADGDDQTALVDAQLKREKLHKEIGAIDQLIASFSLADVEPNAGSATADLVRSLLTREDPPEAFRTRIAETMSGRARGDLQDAVPDREDGELFNGQNRALASVSPEVLEIVVRLVKRPKTKGVEVPATCKDSPPKGKTIQELKALVEKCASDIESALRSAAQNVGDNSLKDAIKALSDRKSKLGTELTLVEQALRQIQARQTKKIDITESAVKYTVPLVGLLMLLILLAPRVYPGAAQRAIFQNGLLLELLTVYLLIATILLLGLSEKLDKNSLGTLLGGISGYVLGRAMQSRSRKDHAEESDGDKEDGTSSRIPSSSVGRAPVDPGLTGPDPAVPVAPQVAK